MFKHVLNTRLPPASPRQRSQQDAYRFDCTYQRRLGIGFMRVTPARPPLDSRLPDRDSPPPDERLAERTMPSFDSLYRHQKARLLRFLRRHATSDGADDLLQTTFLRMLALAPERLMVIECPEGYLYKSAQNVARDAAKTASRRPAHLQLWDGEEEILPVQDAIAGLEARDMLKRLEHAMTRLKPLTREIFMAHRLDGYKRRISAI